MTAAQYGREKAVRFGTTASLVGVLTEAVAGTPDADRPAVLFLNSGILHRVGSCRMHVRLARALSAEGFHCLRFDYSGIGDSDQRRDSLSFEESAVVETREAMDYLAKAKGTKRFVLMGLCSGADMAHETALADERVAGGPHCARNGLDDGRESAVVRPPATRHRNEGPGQLRRSQHALDGGPHHRPECL